MSKDSYFQFPLSALNAEKRPSEVDTVSADRIFDRVTDHCVRSLSEYYVAQGDVNAPPDSDLDNDLVCSSRIDSILMGLETKIGRKWERAISADETDLIAGDLLAAKLLGIELTPKSKRRLIKEPYGRTLVRIRSDIFADARAGKIPFQQFAVLCAVHARIGSNSLIPISYKTLRYCASGFSGEREFIASGLNEKVLLTINQIRSAVKTLRSRNLFFTALHKRNLYYSKTDKNIGERVAHYIAEKEVRQRKRKCPIVTSQMVNEQIAKLSQDFPQ